MSKHCSKIKNIIEIARQGQKANKKYGKIEDTDENKRSKSSYHIGYARLDTNVKSKLIHVKHIETPSFWWLLQQQVQQLLQQDFVDITGPIVQIENIGVRMMGGKL